MGGCFSKKTGTPAVAPQTTPAGRKGRRHKKKGTVAFQLQNGGTLPRGGSEPDLSMRSDVRWGQGDVGMSHLAPKADVSASQVTPEVEELETHSSIDAGSIYGTPAGTPRSRIARLISGNDVFHDAQVAFTDSEDEFEAVNADSLESDFGQSPERRRQTLTRLPTIPSALVVDGASTSQDWGREGVLPANGGVAGKRELLVGEGSDGRGIRRRMSDPGPVRGARKALVLDERRPPPLRVDSSPGGGGIIDETGHHSNPPKVFRKAATSARKHTPEQERKGAGTGYARRWSEYDAPDDEPSTSGGIVCLPKIRIGGLDRADSRGSSFRKEKKFFMFGRRSSGGAGFEAATPSDGRRQTVRMPRTGESVTECPEEQLEEGCWARVDAASFVLRGKTYMKDKKKILATAHPIYELLSVDCYHSVRKLMHVAQLMHIPCRGEPPGRDGLPRVLVVNLQFPLYPPAIFGGSENQDGEGFNVIMTFRLNADFERNPPPAAFALLKRFLADEQEKVGLMSSHVSLRDRLKLIASMRNLDEIEMSLTERKLANNYNGKPVLSRPQHVFFQNDNYMEIDIDVHRFSFLARKGLESFRQRLKQMVIDFALIIQGNKPDELPEHVLCCACVNKFDFANPALTILDEEQREHPDRSQYAPETPVAKLGESPHT